jgi:hypothetical protein
MSPITLTIFVGTSSISVKSRMTIPLFRRELCGPKVGVSGDRAVEPLACRTVGDHNRVNLDKRVSELRSVSYVTVRPTRSNPRLRISPADPDNKLNEIPPRSIEACTVESSPAVRAGCKVSVHNHRSRPLAPSVLRR